MCALKMRWWRTCSYRCSVHCGCKHRVCIGYPATAQRSRCDCRPMTFPAPRPRFMPFGSTTCATCIWSCARWADRGLPALLLCLCDGTITAHAAMQSSPAHLTAAARLPRGHARGDCQRAAHAVHMLRLWAAPAEPVYALFVGGGSVCCRALAMLNLLQLWQRLPRRPGDQTPSICVAAFPTPVYRDDNLDHDFTYANIVTSITFCCPWR